MYQALYRKWRPRVFNDVVGQPHITKTLKNELIAGRIAHAYLFTGSRGTGKTTCAKILAKAVNCLDLQNGDPCNICDNCRGIDSGSILDVVEIDAASNNGVDSIRDLRDEAIFTPAIAKYRVYIIDEAHMLSTGAFNALLKTLEEPPAYVIFILATTEVHKLPATILSRCQRFDFRRIPVNDIAERIIYVAHEENLKLTEGAATMISRLADGALRDALSMLDRCAGSGNIINEEAVSKTAGLTGSEYLFELSQAIRTGDSAAVLKIIDTLYSSSKDVERLCEELISHFRNIMILKSLPKDKDMLNSPTDEAEKLTLEAAGFTMEAVLHILDTLQAALEVLHYSASRRVEMEMALLRLCNPSLDSSNAALLRRIAALEDKMRSGVPNATATTNITVKPNMEERKKQSQNETREQEITPTRGAPASLTDDSTDEPLACWPEILEALSRIDPALRGFLNDSAAILRGNHVLIDSTNSMFAELIRQPNHQKPLVDAIRNVTGKPYKVGILKKKPKPLQNADDPLDEILKSASAAGIGINEK